MNEPEVKKEDWERNLLENLALAALREQRRTRTWGIFLKCSLFYIFSIAVLCTRLDRGWKSTNI